MAQLCDLAFKCIFRVNYVKILSVDESNLILKSFRLRTYVWQVLIQEKLNYQHVYYLSQVWVGFGIEGWHMLA